MVTGNWNLKRSLESLSTELRQLGDEHRIAVSSCKKTKFKIVIVD